MKLQRTVAKVLAILVIVMLLAVALSRIEGLVYERQARSAQAEQGITQSLAGRQSLLGPVLLSQCTETWDEREGTGKDGKTVSRRRDFQLSAAPKSSSIDAKVTMEVRYRGLFKVNTYVTNLRTTAEWGPLAALRPQPEHAGSRSTCAPPVLMVAVSDARGIRQAAVSLEGQALAVEAGTLHDKYLSGFHAALPEARRSAEAPLQLQVDLQLVGVSSFGVVPIAQDSRVQLAADWPHPSFNGRFLPVDKKIRDDGFNATWRVSALATQATQDFAHGVSLCPPDGPAATDDGPFGVSGVVLQRGNACIDTLNVAFIDPVNPYSLSDRAVKYGMLFVGLTFVAVGMVELLQRRRVHPMQYLLVGCAISLFFLLLLGLSEHLGFAVSYAVAAGAGVALLAFYGRHVLGSWRAGASFGAGIAGLYGALYVLLQLEQSALVVGAVLLFCVLATVMYATRHLDWYGITAGPPNA